jgi:hypothetical protein
LVLGSAMVTVFPLCWGEDVPAERPAVTPYRPSVSTPAALSAPGWLEAEAGFLRVGNSGVNLRESFPYSLKLAFSADWGIVGELSGTRQRGADPTAQGLCAASYSPTRSITLDGGVAKGLLPGYSSWSVFLGFTALAGRVF